MGTPRNLSGDTTLAYLLKKNDSGAKAAAEKAAQGVTDDLQPQIDENAMGIEANAAEIAKTCKDLIDVTLYNVSSSKRTFSVEGVTSRHELVQNGFAYLTNPEVQESELSLTTSENTVTVNGTLNGTTTIIATLCIKEQKKSGS